MKIYRPVLKLHLRQKCSDDSTDIFVADSKFQDRSDDITDAVLASKKYNGIGRDVAARVVAENIVKFKKPKDVIKAVKKELHIIHESFLSDDSHTQAAELLKNYKEDKDFILSLMGLHSSTRERLAQVEEIYNYVSGFILMEDGVVDLGCGFNPFAMPLLDKKPKEYLALDIGEPMIALIKKYFLLSGLPYQAAVHDAMTNPIPDTDVLLMFKLFPLLERQKKNHGFDILQQAAYRTAILSFPLKSASGKEKGMKKYYSEFFINGLPEEIKIIDSMAFKNEMFFVCQKYSYNK